MTVQWLVESVVSNPLMVSNILPDPELQLQIKSEECTVHSATTDLSGSSLDIC